jgi:peptidoglycan/LPS O-acetylase OafA/YrhL
LAAVVVLLHHSLLLIPALAAPYYDRSGGYATWSAAWWAVETPLHLFWEGQGSVYVFFVLSGIVLTLPVLRAARFGWRSYYPQRLIRLYLPVWAAVVFAVGTIYIVARTGGSGSAWLDWHPSSVTLDALARDVTLVFGAGSLASPLWSLRWEVLFSLALPIYIWLALVLRRFNFLKAAACIVVSTAGGALGYDSLKYLPMFMVGVLIASSLSSISRFFESLNARRSSVVVWPSVLLLAIALITSRWTLLSTELSTEAEGSLTGVMLIGAILIVLCAMHWPTAIYLLEKPWVQWLGTISFSLYLTHEPIAVAFGYLIGSTSLFTAIASALVVSFVVATVFYKFVEMPSHKLAKKVRRRLDRQPTSMQPT